ncbi:MAG: PstS family phosphate ABC transporter substrate-binding protein [Elainellaceae cyanobacterium]
MANQNRERGALAEFLVMISVFVGFGGQVLNFLSPTLNLLTASVITSEERAIDSEQTPEKEPAAEADSFAEVAGVPQGIFNHGGSTTWAKIRENLDASNLENIFPEYRLRYTHPTADEGNPGSHTGIQMLLNGRLSFAVTSRPLREKEMDAAAEQGFRLRQQPVALDANVFVVHPTLDIPGLTLNQIRDIYTGKIRNWQDVGGPDRPITTYAHRSAKTGWFKDVVLGEAVHREDTVWVDTTEGI